MYKQPLRCKKCGKLIREWNKSGFCYGCYNRENIKMKSQKQKDAEHLLNKDKLKAELLLSPYANYEKGFSEGYDEGYIQAIKDVKDFLMENVEPSIDFWKDWNNRFKKLGEKQ